MEKPGTALITGASSGIGKAYAGSLAQRGYGLVLVARRRELLESLAEELRSSHGIEAEVLTADLALDEDMIRVAGRIEAADGLSMLVNNAGFDIESPFAESDIESQLDMVRVHNMATMRLARAALPGMIARRRGVVINVSSIGAFFPLPDHAVYDASKAFLLSFTETLQIELAGTGVHAQVLCPGFTHTNFHAVSGMDTRAVPGGMWMEPGSVVEESLRALERGKGVVIPGMRNRLLVMLSKVPRSILHRSLKVMAEMARKQNKQVSG
jgi:uncharacterized protein